MRKSPNGWRIERLQAVAQIYYQTFCGAGGCGGGSEQMRRTDHRNLEKYQFTVRPLSKEEGGGYLVEYPDIPGCMSDGETVEESIADGREALRECVDVFRES